MIPEEFAEEHGLSLEEAEYVLSRRRNLAGLDAVGGRQGAARLALIAAQKKVGVHPVVEANGELEKTHDPDADVGKVKFYEKQVREVVAYRPQRSGKSDGWEDPP